MDHDGGVVSIRIFEDELFFSALSGSRMRELVGGLAAKGF